MISKTYANKLLNLMTGNGQVTSISAPNSVYLGLCFGEPDATTGALTTSNEPTADSYSRVRVGGSGTNITKYFGAADGGIVSNSEEIKFNTAKEVWGTMHYFFLSESDTGNAFMWGTINDGAGVVIGSEEDFHPTVPVFYANELKASIDVSLSEAAE